MNKKPKAPKLNVKPDYDAIWEKLKVKLSDPSIIAIIKGNWSWKCHRHQDFKASVNKDYEGDMLGFSPKYKNLISAYDDKYPSAIHEVKYLAQCK